MKTTDPSRMLRTAAISLCLAFGSIPVSMAESVPMGWIVVSLSQERGVSGVALVVQPKATRAPDAPAPKAAQAQDAPKPAKVRKPRQVVGELMIDLPTEGRQEWDGRAGAVRVLKVPAGPYRLANFRLEHAPTKGKWFAGDDYDVPFEVKAGEVTYLGEFQGTVSVTKLPGKTGTVRQPYFIVRDQRSRDIPLAEAARPEIRGKAVLSVAPLTPPGKGHFQTSRQPDRN